MRVPRIEEARVRKRVLSALRPIGSGKVMFMNLVFWDQGDSATIKTGAAIVTLHAEDLNSGQPIRNSLDRRGLVCLAHLWRSMIAIPFQHATFKPKFGMTEEGWRMLSEGCRNE